MKQRIKFLIYIPFIFLFSFLIFSCSRKNSQSVENQAEISRTQAELTALLQNTELDSVSRYAIINQIATNLIAVNDQQGLILFLTGWVEEHPDDIYNAYWLLMTAYAYMSSGAEPVAEYYFDRILQGYQDLPCWLQCRS